VDGALTGIASIRPLQLCADGGYQLRFRSLRVPLIIVPDSIVVSRSNARATYRSYDL
jgi:hypothetical protein